jgi:hypothetical protein
LKLKFVLFISLLVSLQCTSNSTIKQIPDKWIIDSTGVGDIKLGYPIPKKIINKSTDMKKKYFFSHIADGVVFEGFKINDPYILVGIQNGPFDRWEKKFGPGKPDIDLNKKAIMAAKKGAIINTIVINSKKYKTKKSIGLGSNFNDLKKAYPDLKKNPVPPTFGGDLCSVTTGELQNVYFYFKNCRNADDNGKIIRIMFFDAKKENPF